MSEHTKGQWVTFNMTDSEMQEWFGICEQGTAVDIVLGDVSGLICMMAEADEKDRARLQRAVVCVNALEGYNPAAVRDVVEAGHAFDNGHITVAKVEALRAALAALEGGEA